MFILVMSLFLPHDLFLILILSPLHLVRDDHPNTSCCALILPNPSPIKFFLLAFAHHPTNNPAGPILRSLASYSARREPFLNAVLFLTWASFVLFRNA